MFVLLRELFYFIINYLIKLQINVVGCLSIFGKEKELMFVWLHEWYGYFIFILLLTWSNFESR